MAKGKLTKSRVDRLTQGEVLWDEDVAGFGVRRRQRETTFVLKYRANGRQRFVTIGRHGSPWTCETARSHARRLLGAIHAGDDPASQRDKRNREPTIEAVLDRYIRDHAEKRYKPSTRHEATRLVNAVLKPAFGKLRIGELTRADIKRWHTGLSDAPYEANHALAYLRKALGLAALEWEYRSDNPALGVQKFPEKKRERFFSDAELQQIGRAFAAIEAEGKAPVGCVRTIRLLALTGMRLGEVIGLQWTWIDFEHGCARLPDAKAGSRDVPLGGPALAYLASLERISPYVCYGKGKDAAKPISRSAVENFWPVLRDRARLKNARMHDFRHTTGTLAAQTGANAFMVRDLLGHSSLEISGGYVARAVDPLRKMADQVSERIAAAMSGGPSADVVQLRKA
jgi:integrase